ncbi:hypothetical protein I79_026200 [Cricetulus griseus]|uniref:Uncharacterized protein n=1 Tax=Cricetulus griseus TaxID=10029 RepID=G3IQ97_CRIGR|nr:hypothetical protein I79_026200 [Cricetulus griseus]
MSLDNLFQTHLLSLRNENKHSGGRARWISKFETRLAYRIRHLGLHKETLSQKRGKEEREGKGEEGEEEEEASTTSTVHTEGPGVHKIHSVTPSVVGNVTMITVVKVGGKS